MPLDYPDVPTCPSVHIHFHGLVASMLTNSYLLESQFLQTMQKSNNLWRTIATHHNIFCFDLAISYITV